MWATIIASLIAALAPLLEQALSAWLNQKLHIAAASMPPPVTSAPSVGAVIDPNAADKTNKLALLQVVKDGLYWFQFEKNRVVDAAIAKVSMS